MDEQITGVCSGGPYDGTTQTLTKGAFYGVCEKNDDGSYDAFKGEYVLQRAALTWREISRFHIPVTNVNPQAQKQA